MLAYFAEQKKRITDFLEQYFQLKRDSYSAGNRWGEDTARRLLEFTSRGKMIRGGLVILSESFFSEVSSADAVKAAGALEIFQSAFLIHDDIMDGDLYRRGEKTVFNQYTAMSRDEGIAAPERMGESLGICAGDLAFFAGFDILTSMEADPALKNRLISLCAEEYFKVGLAQMNDVYLGGSGREFTEEDILNVYRYKTARYTFSLPFMIGAILSGADTETMKNLESIGEIMGIIFQIKDDELGIFSSDSELGKPVGSDIRENKKTIYYYYIMETARNREDKAVLERLERIFGNPDIGRDEIEFVREFVTAAGIRERADGKIAQYSRDIEQAINSTNLNKKSTGLLETLLKYSIERRM
ncbi:MAG: polyprenyl synthetase family protein [Brevinematales bacterium]|nr:polyprenyl synthetase family protein [Brevinematales bacterium]